MAAIHTAADVTVNPSGEFTVRKRGGSGGAEQFVRLDINRTETIQKLVLIDKPVQPDAMFDGVM